MIKKLPLKIFLTNKMFMIKIMSVNNTVQKNIFLFKRVALFRLPRYAQRSPHYSEITDLAFYSFDADSFILFPFSLLSLSLNSILSSPLSPSASVLLEAFESRVQIWSSKWSTSTSSSLSWTWIDIISGDELLVDFRGHGWTGILLTSGEKWACDGCYLLISLN